MASKGGRVAGGAVSGSVAAGALGGSVAAGAGGGGRSWDDEVWKETAVYYWKQPTLNSTASSTGTAGMAGRHLQGNVAGRSEERNQVQRRSVPDVKDVNLKLLMKIEQLELENKREKEEKKRMQRDHMLDRRSRDRKDLAVLLVFALVVIMYVLCALLIRGFV